jgi:hypothetical protein
MQAHQLPDYALLRRMLCDAAIEASPPQAGSCPAALHVEASNAQRKRQPITQAADASAGAGAPGMQPPHKRQKAASPTAAADHAHWLEAEE